MDEFDRNLLRAMVANLHVANGMTMAREMFGKSYFALGVSEKVAVDQAQMMMLAMNYQSLTPEALKQQQQHTKNPFGFGTGAPPETAPKA